MYCLAEWLDDGFGGRNASSRAINIGDIIFYVRGGCGSAKLAQQNPGGMCFGPWLYRELLAKKWVALRAKPTQQ